MIKLHIHMTTNLRKLTINEMLMKQCKKEQFNVIKKERKATDK